MYKFLLLLIIPTFIYAEPGPVTRQLMEEPASLFDVAMLRLENSIGKWENQIIGNYNYKARSLAGRRDSFGNVNVRYEPKTDKIYISLSISDALSTQEQMQSGCQSGLGQVKIIVGKSGSSFFEHHRGAISSTSSSFDGAISEMFEFRCYIYGNDSSKGRFWASQKLGSQMEIGKWPLLN